MKIPQQHYSGFTIPSLEEYLEAAHQKNLEDIRSTAIHLAKKGLPNPTGDNLHSYTGEVISRYDAMESYALQQILPANSQSEVKSIKESTETKLAELRTFRQALEADLLNMEDELKKQGIKLDEFVALLPEKTNDLIPYLIVAGEVILNAGAFQLLGDNLLMSIGISVGVTGGLFLLAKMLGKFLKESTADKKIKILVVVGATALAMAVFYIIASMRTEYLKDQAHYEIHPALLMLINLLFYIVTLWHFYRKTETLKKREDNERLLKLKEKFDGLKKQIAEIKAEEKKISEEATVSVDMVSHKPEYAGYVVERIARWKDEIDRTFIAQNLRSRSDKKTPNCFIS